MLMQKICANRICRKRFAVRPRKQRGSNPNKHRKYCYDCEGTKVWKSLHEERHAFLLRRWIRLNPEKAKLRYRRHRLKTKYGLTIEGLAQLRKKQKNRCAICKGLFNGRWNSPNVDHKHEKKRSHRGLLCVECNLMIGYCHESIRVLKAGIKYLIKWSD